MRDNTEIWMGIRRVMKLYEMLLKDVCSRYDLAPAEADVISFLYYNPRKDTAADIVELRMLSKSTVSKAVETLIQKSILKRNPDKKDRRKIHLELLPEAEPITREIELAQNTFWNIVFRDFSQEERRTYEAFNRRIFKNTQADSERGEEE